jgi:general secretion pathway protein J
MRPRDRDQMVPPRRARSPGHQGGATRWTQVLDSDPHRRNERGYTLLEVIVALVVLGLLMVTLTQGVRLGLQSWAMQGRIGNNANGIETTDRTLRDLISRASPGETASLQSPLIGTSHTLSFVTVLPGNFGAMATHEADVTLLVADKRLELRWRPHYRRWVATPPAPVSSVILDDVVGIDIAYWQPGSGPTGGAWISAWTRHDLPPLVRLHVVFAENDARHWPDIIVAPM